jgi:hypothetical protein
MQGQASGFAGSNDPSPLNGSRRREGGRRRESDVLEIVDGGRRRGAGVELTQGAFQLRLLLKLRPALK